MPSIIMTGVQVRMMMKKFVEILKKEKRDVLTLVKESVIQKIL